jgi:hypothetical protein
MNLLEKYSTTCGVKISNISVPYSYFPLAVDKYIVIDNRNRNHHNTYDLYDDVISYCYKDFIENGISIISLCSSERTIIAKTYPYISLSKKQEAYILKNSLLNICSDNYSSHISDYFGVPSIGLYSTMPSEVTKPIINTKHKVIESKKLGNLCSYFDKENPKLINFISPEEISNAIFESLGIGKKTKNETVYTGNFYAVKVVEVSPDFIPDPNFLKNKTINIRMDYHFDENNLQYWLSNRAASILTNRPVNPEILFAFKKNVLQLAIDINDSFDEDYLKSAQETGVNLKIFCRDKNKLEKYRIKFFDFEIEQSHYKSRKDLEIDDLSNLKFLSSRMLISNNKKYSCKRNLDLGIELGQTYENIIDEECFWEDLDYYRIIKEA